MMIAKEDRRERKGKKVHKKRCHAKTREARKHTFCQKREKREKKVKPKNFQKTPLLFFVKKSNHLSLEASLLLVHNLLKESIHTIIDNNDNDNTSLLPERRFRRCPTRIKTILIILIKTRSIAYERLRMPFRTTNGSRLAIYTPSFRSFPVALVGYDERCLFALQRWTRWWKQRQRQQQKRRR